MKHSPRALRTILSAAALSACLMISAAALPYGEGTTTTTLRLRESASTSSSILASVPSGSEVTVLEAAKDGWYKVEWKNKQGYMSAQYLTVRVNETNLGTGTLNTNGKSLNMRSGPGTSYSKVASIPANATLTIVSEENGWYKATYNGLTGYVSSSYVTLSGTSAGETSTPSETTTPNETPTPSETTTPSVTTVQIGKLKTNGKSLNMRSGPGTSYKKLVSIPASATLTITGLENGWYKTSYNGVSGYVSSSYVTVSEVTVDTPTTPEQNFNAELAAQVVEYAKQFLGTPYKYGANGPSAYDCSAFTSTVYKHFGYKLNRSAAGQYNNGTVIDESQVQPGDLLLWRSYKSSSLATHVGIYIGDDQYIHASSTGGCVMTSSLSRGSNSRYLVGVRRIIE